MGDGLLKVLIAGLGSIGVRHARLLRERFPDEIRLISFRTGKGQQSVPDDLLSAIEMEESFAEALEKDPDIAFVTNPTHRHVSTATACAETGAHLFIEKPLSHSLDGLDRLRALIDEKDLVTMVGCQLRFHPLLRKTKGYLEDGQLGTIYSFRASCGSYLPDWRPDQDYRESYSAKSSMGGGVVLDLIHELDYASWLFGGLEEVEGKTAHVSDLDIETEDIAEMVFRLPDGGLGQIHLDYLRKPPERSFSMMGEKGALTGDLIEGDLTLETEDNEETSHWEVSRDVLFVEQLNYFMDCVQGGEKTFNEVEDNEVILRNALSVK